MKFVLKFWANWYMDFFVYSGKIKQSTVVWIYELDFWIAQGMWLGPWSKAPIGQLEFIEN